MPTEANIFMSLSFLFLSVTCHFVSYSFFHFKFFRLHATDELVGAVASEVVSERAEVVPLVIVVLGVEVKVAACEQVKR